MMAYFGVLQNLMVEVPRHAASGDSTIQIALSPQAVQQFEVFCQEEIQRQGSLFPFQIVK